jgi:hypothetical protein
MPGHFATGYPRPTGFYTVLIFDPAAIRTKKNAAGQSLRRS